MSCEDCEDSNAIFRTPGSWFVDFRDDWVLVLRPYPVATPLEEYHIPCESKEGACLLYEEAITAQRQGESACMTFLSRFTAFDRWKGFVMDGVYRIRTLKEKKYVKFEEAPSFEEQKGNI